MHILVACEESQRVCEAFRKKGHIAFSCDIEEQSGGHPEWHIKQDVLPLLNGFCSFVTCDGVEHSINKKWDMILAFPPCTYLTVTGNRWFNVERYGDKAIERHKKREEAIEFFLLIAHANCEKIIIENPVGVISTRYKKPNQIIHPYMFGEPYSKKTCLWLKGVENLKPTNILEKPASGWVNQSFTPDGRYGGYNSKFSGSKIRSKTFKGIAQAMAEQWG
jgi:site-specific DNA-cytosine methylase